ncbi:MAG: T9SS type A sorting domain-containing protein [Bacteroidales bacterium]|nr:T9SS type A sorting domain-containing protein [Bacteroidales bacterium]
MKYLCTLFLLLSVMLSVTIQGQNVPNSDFENWYIDTLYEEPQGFSTINIHLATMGLPAGVERTSDSYSGNYAVSLTSRKAGNDTIPAYIGTGPLQDMGRGIPYNENPDSISVYVKENLVPGDTAVAYFLFTSMTNMIGYAEFRFSDSATSYQLFKKEVVWFTTGIQPDSVTIMIGSAEFGDISTPGSNLLIDSISFGAGYSDIPNHNFETWNTFSTETPENWTVLNAMSDLSNPMVTKTTDSYSGTYAVSIKNKVSFFGDTMGFLTNGNWGGNGPQGGYGVYANPKKITGYYKYTPSGPDTALAGAFSYVWDNGAGKLVQVDSSILKLPPANSYTAFELPLNYDLWPLIDTLNITFAAGNFLTHGAHVGLNSELIVDSLNVQFITSSISHQSNSDLSVWPNPASDMINIKIPGKNFSKLEIISLEGRILRAVSVENQNRITLNTKNLPKGLLFFKFDSENKTRTIKIIIH